MGWFVSDERVPVEGLACRCSGGPHPDGDTVWLRQELGPGGGYAALAALRKAQEDPEALSEQLGRVYVKFGVVDWTFLDDEGEPIPCTPENAERLSWDVVYPVAEAADTLYAESLLRPLVARLSKSSRNGRTAESTSARRRSSSTRPKQSRPSTTATTRSRR